MSDETAKENESHQGWRRLISGSAEIAGGAVGGALGFLAGGPAGAALLGAGGAVAAMVLKQIGEEASNRLLGDREKVRVGGVLAIAAVDIKDRLESGEKLRSDGFFEAKPGERSSADEVAEGVMLKSQREPEEKKIQYMGHLLSNVAFNQEVSANLAHQITKIAEGLTYRQLCILKLAAHKERFALRQSDYRGQGSFQRSLYEILYECLDLYTRGLINFGGEVAFGPTDVKPGSMTVQGIGADIYNLMSLWRIPDEDILPMADTLR